MVFENGVKNIQAAAYNGACTVYKWVLNFSYEVKSLSVGFFEWVDETSELLKIKSRNDK
jgi:hypothetical protein